MGRPTSDVFHSKLPLVKDRAVLKYLMKYRTKYVLVAVLCSHIPYRWPVTELQGTESFLEIHNTHSPTQRNRQWTLSRARSIQPKTPYHIPLISVTRSSKFPVLYSRTAKIFNESLIYLMRATCTIYHDFLDVFVPIIHDKKYNAQLCITLYSPPFSLLTPQKRFFR